MSDYGRELEFSPSVEPLADEDPLDCPPSRWIETLIGFALEHGMDTFIFCPPANMSGSSKSSQARSCPL